MFNKIVGFFLLFVSWQGGFAAINHTLFGRISTYHGDEYILQSDDNNKWRLINPLEYKLKDPHFISSVCSGISCVSIATSDSQLGNNKRSPVILSSQDGGTNWRHVKYINGIHTRLDYLQGSFWHLVCYEQLCFASGLVKDEAVDDKLYSLIISEDGGNTWSIPKNQNNSDSTASLYRRDLYCNKNQCVSRCKKEDSFLVSQDNGESWQLIKYTLPDSEKIEIEDLAVSGENFVAVGHYVTQEAKVKPLIIISADGGLSWTVKVDDVKNDKHHFKSINNLHCNKNICIAHTANRENAMLMLSTDAGITWQAYSTSDKLPENALSMQIEKSICTDNACAMIGRLSLGRGSRPLIATLNLHEETHEFHYVSSSLHPDIALHDINCSDNKCYIAGNYYARERHKSDPPVLLESDDFMMSWLDISDKNHILKPGDWVDITSMATPGG